MGDNQHFSKIFEASPVPTVVLAGNFPGIFVKEANAAYIALTGRTRAELVGNPYFITAPHPGMNLSPKGFEDVRGSLEKAFREKSLVKTPLQLFLKPIPNSSDFETLYLEATNMPVFTADGEIDFMVRTLQNVTDIVLAAEKEKAKDKQLVENERFLNETQKVARIGSWVMDSSGRFLWSDIHYEMMEVEPGTEITADIGVSLLKEQKDRDIFEEVYKNAVEKGDRFDVELNIITPKGNERWIRWTGKGELNDGQFIRMYGTGQDITEQKLTQLALLDSNLLMEQSEELAHFGSVQYDIGTGELTWSKELFNIFGIDNSITPTVDFYYEALHPDDKDRVKATIQNFLATKEDYVGEERIIWPNGEVRHLRTWGRIRTNSNGAGVKVTSAYLDITESKSIQEDLVASESRLRSLVDSQTNYVIRVDFDDNYIYANKKYREDFSAPNGRDLIGTNSMESVPPGQHGKIREVSQKCIAHPNEVFEVEIEKYGQDGSIKHTFWHFVCLTDSSGEPREFQCIGLDVSDRKKAENERERKAAELRLSEQRYSDLFHLSPQPMWVYDPESLQFLDVNNAAVEQYGYSREQFLSMTISDIRTDGELPQVAQGIKLPGKQKDFFKGVLIHKLANGELIKVDLQRNKILFKGKMAQLELAINITDPLKYLEALEKQNLRLAEIAWIQSHVVRAPLSRIMGLVDILQNHSDPAEQTFALEGIASSAAELDAVIKDIVRKAEQMDLNVK